MRVFGPIADAIGRPIAYERLIHMLWSDDLDGGPDDPMDALKVHVCHIRGRLRWGNFPGTIETHWGLGFELIYHPILYPLPQMAEASA